jgi:hypothetical protein
MANIDESNFRECAQEAIKKYRDGGKVIDALVWGTIVRLYNDRLEKMEALLQRWDALYPNVSELGRETKLFLALEATSFADPRGICPGCGDKALHGKVTCGRVQCGTSSGGSYG